jgi:hypothetical protein
VSTTNLKPCRTNNTYILIYYCIVQRNFTHLIRCQTMKVKPYIILNTSRKHVNYEEVSMNKPYNIQNTNICNGIFHISFFKTLLINEGETTRGERESGWNDPGRTGIGAKRLTGRTGFGAMVSKSGNPGPVPKTRAQIRIFFITSLLRH